MNFLYDDIVHVLQNTIDSCINSATGRRGGYVLERMFTKFSEIMPCNGHYAVQGHSRSPILVPIETIKPSQMKPAHSHQLFSSSCHYHDRIHSTHGQQPPVLQLLQILI